MFHSYYFILSSICILPLVCSLHFALSLQSAFYTDRIHSKIIIPLKQIKLFCVHVSWVQRTNPPALQCRGVVYRVACVDCNFVYYGQTDRALETRLKERKRAVQVGDNNSKVAQHANQFFHSIDFDHATTVGRARNFHEKTFSWDLVFAERQQRGKRTHWQCQMFTNPLRNHAQRSLVMFWLA